MDAEISELVYEMKKYHTHIMQKVGTILLTSGNHAIDCRDKRKYHLYGE